MSRSNARIALAASLSRAPVHARRSRTVVKPQVDEHSGGEHVAYFVQAFGRDYWRGRITQGSY